MSPWRWWLTRARAACGQCQCGSALRLRLQSYCHSGWQCNYSEAQWVTGWQIISMIGHGIIIITLRLVTVIIRLQLGLPLGVTWISSWFKLSIISSIIIIIIMQQTSIMIIPTEKWMSYHTWYHIWYTLFPMKSQSGFTVSDLNIIWYDWTTTLKSWSCSSWSGTLPHPILKVSLILKPSILKFSLILNRQHLILDN